jgi:hypothetical protein
MFQNILNKNISIDNDQFQQIIDSLIIFKDKVFNRCWIAEYLPFWNTILKKEIENIKVKKIKYLQIGVFEGMSLLYLTQILLSNFDVEITVIDDFSTEPYFKTEQTFDDNLKNIKIKKIKKDSHTALLELINNNETFDFIYCCGSRKPYIVYVDFALLTKLLNNNTYLLVDDYSAFSSYSGDIEPNLVKDIFIKSFKKYHKNIGVGEQNLLIFNEIKQEDYKIIEKKPDCINRTNNKSEYNKYKNKYNFLKNELK